MIRSLVIGISMLAAMAGAWWLTPKQELVAEGEVRFAEIVPSAFADWTLVPNPFTQVDLAVKRDLEDEASLLYDEVLSRSYRNADGQVVMLSVAYGRRQRQELKIHRPELCYAAQGFKVSGLRSVDAGGWREGTAIDARRLLAIAPNRIEPVMYWIRIGGEIANSPMQSRLTILRNGLGGQIPDGVLVRTSQVVRHTELVEDSIALQRRFVAALIQSLAPQNAQRFLGT